MTSESRSADDELPDIVDIVRDMAEHSVTNRAIWCPDLLIPALVD